MLSRDGILEVLDAGARAFVFPMLDNGYVYLAASRLALFRSDIDWAMTFEIFGYSPRAGVPDLSVTTFGSAVICRKSASDFVSEDAYQAFLVNNRDWQQEIFFPIEDDGWIDQDEQEMVDIAASSLTLRGRAIPLPADADYRTAGVERTVEGAWSVAEMSRALAACRRDAVLASSEERRINLTDTMTELLMLDDWLHPDVVDPACLPNRSQTFVDLAEVLVSGNVGLYKVKLGNTHWSHWPDGGSL